MANVAEKVGEAKDKAVPEKRRALGRGLESLLPGPRVVQPSPVSATERREPATASSASGFAASPPAVASTSAGVAAGGSVVQAPQVSATERPDPGGASSSSSSFSPLSSSSGSGSAVSPDALTAPPAGVAAGGSVVQASQVGATERREPGGASSLASSGLAVDEGRVASPMTGLGRPIMRNPAIAEDGDGGAINVMRRREPSASLQAGDLQGAADESDWEGVKVVELPLSKIDPNPYQTRHFTEEDEAQLIDLGKSIKAQGLIQPITVREGKHGRYILIAGDRRTRAARLAELETIAAIVWEVSEQEAAEMTILENLMREDLNCMDQTRAFVLLSSKFKMTQAEIAERMGMSRESVSNYMRLSRLPEEVQDFLIKGDLEFSHARLLLKIESDEVLLAVARKVVKERIPVWELEDMMLSSNPTLLKPPDEKKHSRGARWVDPNVRAAQRDLERILGMRVRIRDRNNKGRIVIEYGTLEDFDRVVGALKGK